MKSRHNSLAEETLVGDRPIPLAVRIAEHLRIMRIYGLAAVLIFGVLAFGAVENWSGFAVAAGAATLLLLWATEQVLRNRIALVWSPLFLPLCGFGAVLLIQCVAHVTAYWYVSRISLLTCVTLAILGFIAVQTMNSLQDVERFATVMIIFGFLLAVFAILQRLASPGRIYWTVLPPDAGLVFGPYVNRNHFAGCMELLAPLALVRLFNDALPSGKRAMLGFMAIIMGASILLSQSRAGSVAFAFELLVFGLMYTSHKHRGRVFAAMASVVVIAVSVSFWIGGDALLSRFSEMQGERVHIAADTMRMVKMHPWIGWGAGTFESVYREFRSWPSIYVVDHAHNDYLEALVETGVVGFSMVVLFIVLLYRTARRSLAVQASPLTGIQMAALVGCTGLLLHSFVDFNMHIPANAALFLVLALVAAKPVARAPQQRMASSRLARETTARI